MHRPYPNRDRALRHVQRTRAVYQYGRVPQRWVLGVDPGACLGEPAAAIAARAQARMLQVTGRALRFGKTAALAETTREALARGEHVHVASARDGVRYLNRPTEQDRA